MNINKNINLKKYQPNEYDIILLLLFFEKENILVNEKIDKEIKEFIENNLNWNLDNEDYEENKNLNFIKKIIKPSKGNRNSIFISELSNLENVNKKFKIDTNINNVNLNSINKETFKNETIFNNTYSNLNNIFSFNNPQKLEIKINQGFEENYDVKHYKKGELKTLRVNKNSQFLEVDLKELHSIFLENKRSQFLELLDLIKSKYSNEEFFEFFSFKKKIENKDFPDEEREEFNIKIFLRYNFLSEKIEFVFNDMSEILNSENLHSQNKIRKKFLKKFSHEFRNPLLNIIQIIKNLKNNNPIRDLNLNNLEPITKIKLLEQENESDENKNKNKYKKNFDSFIIKEKIPGEEIIFEKQIFSKDSKIFNINEINVNSLETLNKICSNKSFHRK